MQPKICDATLMNTKECNEEHSWIKRVQQQLCSSNATSRKLNSKMLNYLLALPSPHFWKKIQWFDDIK
jgi:hypothetical protein